MRTKKRRGLSESELEVMKVLWDKGSATIREVQEELGKRKRLAFNTVMTFLARMYDKGYVSRKKVGDIYVYRAKVDKTKLLKGLAGKLINRAFSGSLDPLVAYIAESRKLSPEQIRQLKKLIGESVGDKKSEGGER